MSDICFNPSSPHLITARLAQSLCTKVNLQLAEYKILPSDISWEIFKYTPGQVLGEGISVSSSLVPSGWLFHPNGTTPYICAAPDAEINEFYYAIVTIEGDDYYLYLSVSALEPEEELNRPANARYIVINEVTAHSLDITLPDLPPLSGFMELYYSTDLLTEVETWSKVSTTFIGGEDYSLEELDAETPYYLICKTYRETGDTWGLVSVGITEEEPGPDEPSLPILEPFSDKITVTGIILPTGATSLYIEWALFTSDTWTRTVEVTGDSSFDIVGLTSNTKYKVRFVSVNDDGETLGDSVSSITLKLAPEKPQLIEFDNVEATRLNINLSVWPERAEYLRLQLIKSGESDWSDYPFYIYKNDDSSRYYIKGFIEASIDGNPSYLGNSTFNVKSGTYRIHYKEGAYLDSLSKYRLGSSSQNFTIHNGSSDVLLGLSTSPYNSYNELVSAVSNLNKQIVHVNSPLSIKLSSTHMGDTLYSISPTFEIVEGAGLGPTEYHEFDLTYQILLTDLTPNTIIKARWVAVNNGGEVIGDGASTKLNETESILPPLMPDAPTRVGDFTNIFISMVFSSIGINIKSPIWNLSATYPVEGLEIWKKVGEGSYVKLSSEFTESEQIRPENIDRAIITKYKVRAYNTNDSTIQYSPFSDELSVSTISDVVTIEIQVPTDNTTVHFIQNFTLEVLDDNDGVDGAAHGLPELRVRNSLVPDTLEVTRQNYTNRFDSRAYSNGSASVDAYVLGTDDLWAIDTITINIDNNLSNTTYYKEWPFEIHSEGLKAVKAVLSYDSYSLAPKPLNQGWLSIGFRTTGNALPSTPTTEQYETWWKEFKLVPNERSVCWKEVSGNLVKTSDYKSAYITQFSGSGTIGEGSSNFWFGFKITPSEVQYPFALNAERVRKVRRRDESNFDILTQNPSRLLHYNGTLLTEDVILSDFNQSTCIDAEILDDKVYVITSDNKLRVLDTTSGESSYFIQTDETRTLKALEKVDGILFLIFGDANSTAAYSVNDLVLLWDLPVGYTGIKVEDTQLVFWKVNKIYASETGKTLPIIVPYTSTAEGFPNPIVDVNKNVVLTNTGKIYKKFVTEDFFTLIYNLGNMTTKCLSLARVGIDDERPFVGKPGNRLFETYPDYSQDDGLILDVVGTTSGDILSVTQLQHYEKVLVAATGTSTSDPTYVPPVYDDRLLIFTQGPSNSTKAVMIVLQKSDLDEKSGAVLVSRISKPSLHIEEVTKIVTS